MLLKQFINRTIIIITLLLSYNDLCAKQLMFLSVYEESDSAVLDSSQTELADAKVVDGDLFTPNVDTTVVDSAIRIVSSIPVDSLKSPMAENRLEVKRFIPDPKKAMWLAIAFPGGGQIYNRKYWKLPIIYGGFLGCFYALNWNNTMYRDYSQAYIDIMDSDENTKSYMNFIRNGYDVKSNMSYLQDVFKRKKNFYRRYRDMSLFCMIGVYLISIVDAYVDAEMSSFDISNDLSIKISPAIINDRMNARYLSPTNGSSYGVNCSFNF